MTTKIRKPTLIWRIFFTSILMWTIGKTALSLIHTKNQRHEYQSQYQLKKLIGPSFTYHTNLTLTINGASTIWSIVKHCNKKPSLINSNTKKHATCLAMFTLLLSGDVELNPGPTEKSIYPCPFCELNVEYGMKALQCDECDMWYHKTCVSICTNDYEMLENNSKTYLCCRCDHPNYISNISSREIHTENRFEPLTNLANPGNMDCEAIFFSPKIHSSPKRRRRQQKNLVISIDSEDSRSYTNTDTTEDSSYTSSNNSSDTNDNGLPPKGHLFRTAVVNANGLETKIADLEHLVMTTKADQFIITETKLNEEKFDAIKNKLISLGYTPYREDCKGNEKGVMIMIKMSTNILR